MRIGDNSNSFVSAEIYRCIVKTKMPRKQQQHVPRPHVPNPPPRSVQAPAQATRGLLGTMVEGVALGAGSSVGRRMVDGLMAPTPRRADPSNSFEHRSSVNAPSCDPMIAQYNDCMNRASENCENFYRAYTDCLANLHDDVPLH